MFPRSVYYFPHRIITCLIVIDFFIKLSKSQPVIINAKPDSFLEFKGNLNIRHGRKTLSSFLHLKTNFSISTDGNENNFIYKNKIMSNGTYYAYKFCLTYLANNQEIKIGLFQFSLIYYLKTGMPNHRREFTLKKNLDGIILRFDSIYECNKKMIFKTEVDIDPKKNSLEIVSNYIKFIYDVNKESSSLFDGEKEKHIVPTNWYFSKATQPIEKITQIKTTWATVNDETTKEKEVLEIFSRRDIASEVTFLDENPSTGKSITKYEISSVSPSKPCESITEVISSSEKYTKIASKKFEYEDGNALTTFSNEKENPEGSEGTTSDKKSTPNEYIKNHTNTSETEDPAIFLNILCERCNTTETFSEVKIVSDLQNAIIIRKNITASEYRSIFKNEKTARLTTEKENPLTFPILSSIGTISSTEKIQKNQDNLIYNDTKSFEKERTYEDSAKNKYFDENVRIVDQVNDTDNLSEIKNESILVNNKIYKNPLMTENTTYFEITTKVKYIKQNEKSIYTTNSSNKSIKYPITTITNEKNTIILNSSIEKNRKAFENFTDDESILTDLKITPDEKIKLNIFNKNAENAFTNERLMSNEKPITENITTHIDGKIPVNVVTFGNIFTTQNKTIYKDLEMVKNTKKERKISTHGDILTFENKTVASDTTAFKRLQENESNTVSEKNTDKEKLINYSKILIENNITSGIIEAIKSATTTSNSSVREYTSAYENESESQNVISDGSNNTLTNNTVKDNFKTVDTSKSKEELTKFTETADTKIIEKNLSIPFTESITSPDRMSKLENITEYERRATVQNTSNTENIKKSTPEHFLKGLESDKENNDSINGTSGIFNEKIGAKLINITIIVAVVIINIAGVILTSILLIKKCYLIKIILGRKKSKCIDDLMENEIYVHDLFLLNNEIINIPKKI